MHRGIANSNSQAQPHIQVIKVNPINEQINDLAKNQYNEGQNLEEIKVNMQNYPVNPFYSNPFFQLNPSEAQSNSHMIQYFPNQFQNSQNLSINEDNKIPFNSNNFKSQTNDKFLNIESSISVFPNYNSENPNPFSHSYGYK